MDGFRRATSRKANDELIPVPEGQRLRFRANRRFTVESHDREIASLRTQVAALRAQLQTLGFEPIEVEHPDLARLTRQQAALVGALLAVHPRGMDWFDIDEAVPHHDHAKDRDLRWVAVQVSKIKTALEDKTIIENVWGRGYRLSDAFAARLNEGGGA